MSLAAIQQAASRRTYRSLVLGMAPVAYWMLAGTGRDEMGHAHGVLTNGAAAGSPIRKHQQASLAFDGDDDFVELGSIASSNPMSLAGLEAMTIVAWINSPLNGDVYSRIVDKSSGGAGADGYYLAVRGSAAGSTGALSFGVAGTFVDSTGLASANATTMISVSWARPTATFYVNATSGGTGAVNVAVPSTTTNARIGTWNHTTAREFKGRMSDLMLFPRALAAGDITALYLAGRDGRNQFGA